MMRIVGHSRDVRWEAFTEGEIAYMENTGTTMESGSCYYYTDCKDMSKRIWDNFEEDDSYDYGRHKDWAGCCRICWSMWEIEPDDEITVVGIQRGNILTFCEELSDFPIEDCIVSEVELMHS